MNLVFFTHPSFLGHQSMPRFANMLAEGMRKRGHSVSIWSPEARFSKIGLPMVSKKWLGYIDQYVLFPNDIRTLLKTTPENTLFVFTDHALGPWVPLVRHYPHVIHCHDFLAQQSALGMIPQNRTGWTGQQYQKLIHRGYSKGKNFISVSEKTKSDLHQFLTFQPEISEVVYNGLNQSFKPLDIAHARILLGEKIGRDLRNGFLLHVGGNQWYKNRAGVIEIYDAFRKDFEHQIPLLLVGEKPSEDLMNLYFRSQFKSNIHILPQLRDDDVRVAYAGASVFLFPSLAEGFGWPIAEAMASGTPVITTNEAPMTEVAGAAGFLIPRQPTNKHAMAKWLSEAARMVNKVVELSEEDRNLAVEAGLENAKRFDSNFALDKIENIYEAVVKGH